MLYDGDGRKNLEIYKRRNKGKNSPFGCPPILPSTKCRPTVFQCSKTPKTSRTYAKWERAPNLMGKKRQGWARYGQLMGGNMDFVHVKFQDLQ